MGKQTFKYIGLCIAFYLCISLLELFFANPLIDFIGTGFWIHMITYCILLILINPILTYFLVNRLFKFEPDIITSKVNK